MVALNARRAPNTAENAAFTAQSVVGKVSAIFAVVQSGDAYSPTEIAVMTGLTVSTAHRLATELVEHRMLERTASGRLRQGPSLRRLVATVPLCMQAVQDRVRAVINDVAAILGQEIHGGTLNKRGVAYFCRGPDGSGAESLPTATLPFHATALGQVVLAFAPSQLLETIVADQLYALSRDAASDRKRFREMIVLTRQRRYAVADREPHVNFCSVAVPVFGAGGDLVAAIEARAGNPTSAIGHSLPVLKIAAGSLARQLMPPECACTESCLT